MRTENVLMNSLEIKFEQVWAWRLSFLTFPSDPASVAHQPVLCSTLVKQYRVVKGLLLVLIQLTLCFQIGFIIK